MSDQDKGFRVVDKRGQSEEKKDTQAQEKSGQGFVMKDDPNKKEVEPAKIDFSTFVFSLATSALISVGLAPDPVTNKIEKNLPLAKQNIDILSMLDEKTKGNLSEDEAKLLRDLLTETRLRYVEATRKSPA